MPYTYEQLSKMTVTELRVIADGIDHEATKGHSLMHKEKLLPAICVALGIEGHAHHMAVGVDKAKLKVEIRQMKVKRAEAIQKKDYNELRAVRAKIHHLKRFLRKHIV
jgi:hypothetical protein